MVARIIQRLPTSLRRTTHDFAARQTHNGHDRHISTMLTLAQNQRGIHLLVDLYDCV